MANWTNPIYDRTQADVDYAREQLSKGINAREYKGCFNPLDANRVENNTRYIADALNRLYYFNKITTINTWYKYSFIYSAHIERIINNINTLWKAYYTPTGSAALPTTLTHYEHANAIEKNLNLLKRMIDNMESSFKECATFECGEE